MSEQNTPPYRRTAEETAFLIQWAEALGATAEEARDRLAEMDRAVMGGVGGAQ